VRGLALTKLIINDVIAVKSMGRDRGAAAHRARARPAAPPLTMIKTRCTTSASAGLLALRGDNQA